MSIDISKNNVFIEGKDYLPDWENDDRSVAKIMTILKSYLELDNVSFLFGAGSSINLGSVSIANIPEAIENKIKSIMIPGSATGQLHNEFISIIKELQNKDPEERTSNGEVKYSLELLLNYLVACDYITDLNASSVKHKLLKGIPPGS
jgi:hypothetical protein